MLSRDDIQKLLDRMAKVYTAGDAAGCAAMFTENAQLHSPFGPPAVGRRAIYHLHEEWVADSGTKVFSILDFGSTDSLGWCLCRFSEDGVEEGTSLLVLEQQSDGIWLIRSCCLHGDA